MLQILLTLKDRFKVKNIIFILSFLLEKHNNLHLQFLDCSMALLLATNYFLNIFTKMYKLNKHWKRMKCLYFLNPYFYFVIHIDGSSERKQLCSVQFSNDECKINRKVTLSVSE